MVVDYRRLNEIAIADEFPLPKQEYILQALVACQWLSMLDALAGFTQLEIDPKEREKLAFRTHHGLWQFVRMPFGYKNGPLNISKGHAKRSRPLFMDLCSSLH